MTASKTYASNQELGLNTNGVVEQYRNKGSIPASAPGSPHHIVNDGGSIRSAKDQTGWRIRCDQVGTDGGYEFEVGSNTHTVMAARWRPSTSPSMCRCTRIEQIGMVSNRVHRRDEAALMAPKKKSYGLQKRSREKFKLDPTKPLKQHEHESDRMFAYFQAYAANPGLKLRELEPLMGVALASISRYRKLYRWDERLKLANIAKLEEQAQGGPLTLTDREITSKLPPPPPPIMRGLHVFAQRFGPLIAPGFEIDAIVDVMLQELESWVEGKFGGRLLMNPPPRSSKTVCAILALAYSLMRFPLRGHILLSANARLASESNAMLRTVVEAALPEGYDLSTDSKSKLGFKIGCQGAHLNVALSRGASLLGWTAHLLLCDDLLGQIHEAEKPELMQTTMRTLTVDALTRLTKDPYGKGGGLCITAQRLGPEDPTGQLISKEKVAEAEGLQTTPWTVVACPSFRQPKNARLKSLASTPTAGGSVNRSTPSQGHPSAIGSHPSLRPAFRPRCHPRTLLPCTAWTSLRTLAGAAGKHRSSRRSTPRK